MLWIAPILFRPWVVLPASAFTAITGMLKRFILIAGVTTTLALPATAQYSRTDPAIAQQCKEEWGSDFVMISYCRDQHVEAIGALNAKLPRIQADPALRASLAYCEDEWMPNYRMTNYCLDKEIIGQEEAAAMFSDKTIPSNVRRAVETQCREDWGVIQTMIAYCAERQFNAWRDLQN